MVTTSRLSRMGVNKDHHQALAVIRNVKKKIQITLSIILIQKDTSFLCSSTPSKDGKISGNLFPCLKDIVLNRVGDLEFYLEMTSCRIETKKRQCSEIIYFLLFVYSWQMKRE